MLRAARHGNATVKREGRTIVDVIPASGARTVLRPAGLALAALALALWSAACVPNDPGRGAATPGAAGAGSPAASATRSAPPPAASPVAASPAASPGTAANTATGPGTPEARPPVPSAAPAPAAPVAKPAASPAAFASPAPAPSPAAAGTFGFGRPATQDRVRGIDIEIRGSDGAGLPQGGGTATEGRAVYTAKCAACHAANGEGTAAGPKLVDATPFRAGTVTATVGNYWPYAPTLYDYIRRAMPFNAPGSLSDQEVYQLTAFLLSANGLIGENDRMDAQTLPRVQMPNRASFTSPDPRPDTNR
ncbi:MAG: cytochrome c [Chloroflexi bacterium]|nr:cytochrome c [Chloroflexota bacterium]